VSKHGDVVEHKGYEDVQALLRRTAEDATVEFKETLWWDVRQGQYNNDRVLDIAKAHALIDRRHRRSG